MPCPGVDPGGVLRAAGDPWEVEALAPDELQRLVLAAVDPYIDRDVLADQLAREEQQRRVLAAFSTATVLVLSAGQFLGAVSASFVVADAGLILASSAPR